LDIVGEYEIVEWAGNSILVETNLELYSASRGIYNFFKDKGRYDVKADSAVNQINLVSVDKERKPIETKEAEDFNVVDQNTLVRKEPTIKEESN